VTYKGLYFVSHRHPSEVLEIPWTEIGNINKINRLGIDKGIELSTNTATVTFTAVKRCDDLVLYIKLLKSARREHKSYGFVAKDDIEVVKKLTELRAPHVSEDVVDATLTQIATLLKSPELVSEYYAFCGIKDVIISGWAKEKDGLTRSAQFTQAMFQPISVSTAFSMAKSGESLVFDVISHYSRPSAPELLRANLQCFFKQESEKTKLRFAYSLDYGVQTWDKEFIDAAVSRQITILCDFLKARITGVEYNDAGHGREWMKHQPYVLVILGLVALLLAMNILKKDANWLGYMVGFVLIFLVFYG
jgi:hypothetical protein